MKLHYLAPEAEALRLEMASCTLLQGSVTTNDIPDVGIIDFNWEL